MRVAIHTGQVVVSTLDRAQGTGFCRCWRRSQPDQPAAIHCPSRRLLISHEAYRHVRGIFDVTPLEAVQVKGISQPVQIYLVLRAKPHAFRLSTREWKV